MCHAYHHMSCISIVIICHANHHMSCIASYQLSSYVMHIIISICHHIIYHHITCLNILYSKLSLVNRSSFRNLTTEGRPEINRNSNDSENTQVMQSHKSLFCLRSHAFPRCGIYSSTPSNDLLVVVVVDVDVEELLLNNIDTCTL